MTASQVGQYAYCAQAWWLAVVEKRKPENPALLDAGTRAHERHGWQVLLARTTGRLALILFVIALVALATWAMLTYL